MNESYDFGNFTLNATDWKEILEAVQKIHERERSSRLQTLWNNGKVEIPLYSLVFILAVIGNLLVIFTLALNSRMRTNTNVFLLNLAVADLMLAVFCMPFTLIGALLKDFIFGEFMCRLVPFFQANSVTVSVWTLVALSVERYFAICHPLRSRQWQTLSHAYRIIAAVWAGGLLICLPILLTSELQPTSRGRRKCREKWPTYQSQAAYNIFLDITLLVIPLLILIATYYSIAVTLWKDMHKTPGVYDRSSPMKSLSEGSDLVPATESLTDLTSDIELKEMRCLRRSELSVELAADNTTRTRRIDESGELLGERFKSVRGSRSVSFRSKKFTGKVTDPVGLRRTNQERSLNNKKRIIKMLCVIVLIFFISWTPLYVINTLALFYPQFVYQTIGYKTISFCHLLAFTSGCINPITYCFMNRGFRVSFRRLFKCRKRF